MAGIVGEPLNRWVSDQIKERQKLQGKFNRDIKDVNYLNNKNSFLKLASGVFLENNPDPATKPGSVFGNGLEFPMNYVLFNGQTSFSISDDEFDKMHIERTEVKTKSTGVMPSGIGKRKAYDTSDKDYGIVPMPGIISADIRSKERGSIREANIKIKANSKRQFQIIDELYLRLGYDMLLEWGWNLYPHKGKVEKVETTLVEEQWFQKEDVDYLYWLVEIEDLRKRYHGNYDAFFGKVTNFKWDFNKDGTYDINLKLISHGDVIESLRTVPSLGLYSKGSRITLQQYFNSIATDPYLKEVVDFENILTPTGIKFGAKPIISDDGEESETPYPYEVDLVPVKDRISEYVYNVQICGYALSNGQLYNQKSLNWFKVIGGVITGLAIATTAVLTGGGTLVVAGAVGVGGGVGGGLFTANTDWAYDTETFNVKISFPLWTKSIRNGYIPQPISFSNTIALNAQPRGKYVGRTFLGRKNENRNRDGVEKAYENETNHDAFFLWYTPEDTVDDDKTPDFEPKEMFSYIRLEHLFEIINQGGIPKNGKTQNGICHILTEPIPMYVPDQTNLTLSYRPSKFIIHNPNHNFDTIYEKKVDGKDVPTVLKVSDNISLATKNVYYGLNEAIKTGAGVNYIDARNIYVRGTYILDKIPISANDNNETRIDLYGFLKTICTDINEAFGSINNLEPIVDELTNDIRIVDSTNFSGKNKLLKYLDLPIPKPDEDAVFQLYGYKRKGSIPYDQASFIRDVNISTKITKEMAAMITIGATAKGSSPSIDATSFSRFNVGKINRFATVYERSTPKDSPEDIKNHKVTIWYRNEINKLIHSGVTGEKVTEKIEKLKESAKKFSKNPDLTLTDEQKFVTSIAEKPASFYGYDKQTAPSFGNISQFVKQFKPDAESYETRNWFDAGKVVTPFFPLWRFDPGAESKNVRTFQNIYAKHEAIKYKNTLAGSPSVGFIPFEMSLTMDGLSGVKIYSGIKTNTEFLPDNYPKTLEFITKGVDHSISNNDWTTKVTTIAVPKSVEDLEKVEAVDAVKVETSTITSETVTAPKTGGADGGAIYDAASDGAIQGLNIDDNEATYDRLRKAVTTHDFTLIQKDNPQQTTSKGIWDEEGPNILCIRNKVTDGIFTNKFDDLMVIAYKLGGKKRVFKTSISADPGKGKGNSQGRLLAPQQFKQLYYITEHRNFKGTWLGPALRPVSIDHKVQVPKKTISKVGEKFEYQPTKTYVPGMIVHRGFGNRGNVGSWSAGCQVFKSKNGMAGFYKVLKNITKGGFYLGNQGVLYSCNTTPNDNQFKNDPIWKLQTTSKSCPKDSTGNRVAPFNYTIMLSDMIEGNPKPTPPTPPTPNPADNMNINKAI